MKIFISWSGDFSREVAEKLSVWIPSVIQSVDVFFSPDDIGKGENWNNVLSKELNNCNFGIVCLTPENVVAPWIHFEAGALAKSMDSRLSSIMLGISPSEIRGPLSRFQNTKFERTDFFKLVQAINNATDRPLALNILDKIFDVMWNELEQEIQPIIQKYEGISTPSETKNKTNDIDAIQEILGIVRKMSSDASYSTQSMSFETEDIPFRNKPSDEMTYLMSIKSVRDQAISNTSKLLLRELPNGRQIIQDLENGNIFRMIATQSKAVFIKDIIDACPDLIAEAIPLK